MVAESDAVTGSGSLRAPWKDTSKKPAALGNGSSLYFSRNFDVYHVRRAGAARSLRINNKRHGRTEGFCQRGREHPGRLPEVIGSRAVNAQLHATVQRGIKAGNVAR